MLLQYRRWVPSSSSSAAAAGDLSLSFNAGPTSESGGGGGGGGGFGAGMWSASSPNYRQQQISYGVPNEIGMMGFRDMFVLAPAATFHYGNNNHQHFQEPTLSFDTNIPLLSASPYIQSNGIDEGVINGGTHCREIHFQQPAETYNNIKKPGIGGATNKATTSACITCRDCGNQAKKGCSFKRCRTCCKSRGYDCSTHVKSTWVPAVRRRERQLMGSGGGGGDFVVGSAGSSQSINSSSSKKPKVVPSQTTAASHASTSNTTPPTSFESGSSHQADHRDVDGKSFAAGGDGSYYNKESLPGQVRAPAVFKCVRVTAMDDGDDEYAYQATVKIGGHVFKGFLYDQGVSDQVSREGIPSMSDLHLGGGGGGGGGRRDGGDSSSSPAVQNMLHSSDVYGISGGHLIGGSSSSFIC